MSFGWFSVYVWGILWLTTTGAIGTPFELPFRYDLTSPVRADLTSFFRAIGNRVTSRLPFERLSYFLRRLTRNPFDNINVTKTQRTYATY